MAVVESIDRFRDRPTESNARVVPKRSGGGKRSPQWPSSKLACPRLSPTTAPRIFWDRESVVCSSATIDRCIPCSSTPRARSTLLLLLLLLSSPSHTKAPRGRGRAAGVELEVEWGPCRTPLARTTDRRHHLEVSHVEVQVAAGRGGRWGACGTTPPLHRPHRPPAALRIDFDGGRAPIVPWSADRWIRALLGRPVSSRILPA